MTRSNVGAGGYGYFVNLAYTVQYEKGGGRETFVVFIPSTTGVGKIVRHELQSEVLPK